MKTINELFGENLTKIRLAKGLSQADLSKKSGLHRQSIYRYETALTSPSIENIFAICKALNVKVSELVRSEWLNKK